MIIVSAFFAGLIFGIGLIISGMANPAKVLGFLDLTGAWDPSLMLVMGGAVAVGILAFTWARRRQRSLLGLEMKLPASVAIDRRLMLGAALFGAGWGIAGFCPGPALVGVAMAPFTGQLQAVVFVCAMLAGMALFELLELFQRRRGG